MVTEASGSFSTPKQMSMKSVQMLKKLSAVPRLLKAKIPTTDVHEFKFPNI
jgi:hypothetical protein